MRLRVFFQTLFIFLSLSAGAQLYTFEVLNHKDGLSMAGINVMMQTDNGMIQIGTDGSESF